MMEGKIFHVIGSTGNDYTVSFWMKDGKLKALCTCKAGVNHVLCKHVLGLIESNKEIKDLFIQSYGNIYDELLANQQELDRLKRLIATTKKNISSSLLR